MYRGRRTFIVSSPSPLLNSLVDTVKNYIYCLNDVCMFVFVFMITKDPNNPSQRHYPFLRTCTTFRPKHKEVPVSILSEYYW